jgi:hypothetical protein
MPRRRRCRCRRHRAAAGCRLPITSILVQFRKHSANPAQVPGGDATRPRRLPPASRSAARAAASGLCAERKHRAAPARRQAGARDAAEGAASIASPPDTGSNATAGDAVVVRVFGPGQARGAL